MAHVMHVFRKRQKLMLAFLGILCMFGFVVVPSVMQLSEGRTAKDPVAATTRYGSIRETELARMRHMRDMLVDQQKGFIFRLVFESQIRGNRQINPELIPFQGDDEETAVMVTVLARKASELGIVVSDEAVNQYLKELSGGVIPPDDLRRLVDDYTQKDVGIQQFYDLLRREISVVRLRQMFVSGMTARALPPAERWEYYQRIKQRARLELVNVSVSDFVDQVPDPTDQQITDYFNKFKDRLPDPSSPEPGFRVPQKIAVEYLLADIGKLTTKYEADVTDTEIEEFYEKNKEIYKNIKLPGPKSTPPAKEPDGDGDKSEGSDDEARPEGGEEKGADSEATDKPATESETPAPDAPKSQEQPQETPPKPEAKPKEQSLDEFSTTREAFAAALRPSLRDAATAGESILAQAEEAQPKDGDKPAAKDDAAAKDPADDEKKPADDEETKPDSEPAEESSTEPEYKPLSEVKDQIRTRLAGSKAREKVGGIFELLTARMQDYQLDAAEAKSAGRPLPTKPDLEAWAAEHDFELKTIDLAPPQDYAGDNEIGQAFVLEQRFSGAPMVDRLFLEFQLFQPKTAQNLSGNMMLFWKTDDVAEHTPEQTDAGVRDTVAKAWKLEQARTPARQHADKLLEQAKEKGGTLTEAFAGEDGLTVTETEFFSWMKRGTTSPNGQQEPARLSTVVGVDFAGPDFMQTVFGLEPGQVAVAVNHPQNHDYVVRLMEYDKLLPVLRAEFMKDSINMYGELANADFMKIVRQWMDQMRDEAGIHWERPPESFGRRR